MFIQGLAKSDWFPYVMNNENELHSDAVTYDTFIVHCLECRTMTQAQSLKREQLCEVRLKMKIIRVSQLCLSIYSVLQSATILFPV